jgi:hypothetical protein
MDFILGAALSMLCTFVTYKFLMPYVKNRKVELFYRQSDVFETIKPALPILNELREIPETQASKYFDSKYTVKVMMFENQAYWIKDNSVFVADIVDGNVDKSGAKVIDTMAMDKVQLDRLSFIVETLTKGRSNDSGNSRYP